MDCESVLKSLKKTSADALDFERDLATSQEDIEALRAHRPIRSTGDLRNLNRLRSPFPQMEEEPRRRVHPKGPPFEL